MPRRPVAWYHLPVSARHQASQTDIKTTIVVPVISTSGFNLFESAKMATADFSSRSSSTSQGRDSICTTSFINLIGGLHYAINIFYTSVYRPFNNSNRVKVLNLSYWVLFLWGEGASTLGLPCRFCDFAYEARGGGGYHPLRFLPYSSNNIACDTSLERSSETESK